MDKEKTVEESVQEIAVKVHNLALSEEEQIEGLRIDIMELDDRYSRCGSCKRKPCKCQEINEMVDEMKLREEK